MKKRRPAEEMGKGGGVDVERRWRERERNLAQQRFIAVICGRVQFRCRSVGPAAAA